MARRKKSKWPFRGAGSTDRVLRLIKETSDQRGDDSEEVIVEILESLDQVLSVDWAEKFSPIDCQGIDLDVTLFDGQTLGLPLQVKSSLWIAKRFINERRSIPVLVREPGASREVVIDAFWRIVQRYRKNHKKIIEVAKFR